MDMTKIYEGINSTFLNYKDATELILKCKCPIHKCDLIYNDKDNMWGCDTDDCSVKVQLGGGGHYELSEGPDKLINCLMKKISASISLKKYEIGIDWAKKF